MDAMMLDADLIVGDGQPLTVLDRCDRCGAQAYVRVTVAAGDLLFCGHHAKQFDATIKSQALAIRNETDKLLDKS